MLASSVAIIYIYLHVVYQLLLTSLYYSFESKVPKVLYNALINLVLSTQTHPCLPCQLPTSIYFFGARFIYELRQDGLNLFIFIMPGENFFLFK